MSNNLNEPQSPETENVVATKRFSDCLPIFRGKFGKKIKDTNRSDKYWDLVHNGFHTLETLLSGHNPLLTQRQIDELTSGLDNMATDLNKLNNTDPQIPTGAFGIAAWLIALSTAQRIQAGFESGTIKPIDVIANDTKTNVEKAIE